MYKMKNWSVVLGSRNYYLAPELDYLALAGEIFDHPKFDDGSYVTTSPIVSSDGLKISTKSNSVYLLDGEPSQEYKEYLKENNISYNPENPITFKEIG